MVWPMTDDERRGAYFASERSNRLIITLASPNTYAIVAASDASVVRLAPGSSLAQVKTHGRAVDPSFL